MMTNGSAETSHDLSGKDPITSDNFNKLMDVIQTSKTQLDLKLAKFKEELIENQEKAATSATSTTGALLLQEEKPPGTISLE